MNACDSDNGQKNNIKAKWIWEKYDNDIVYRGS